MTRRRNHTRKGFNLIEAAIVLGVVGFVIGGIWTAASAVSEDRKVTKTAQDFEFIINNLQRLISRADSIQIGHAVTITSQVLAMKAFPQDWVSGSSLKSPFGGSVRVSNWIPPRFGIYLDHITTSNCIKLAVKVSSLGAVSGNTGIASFGYNKSLGQIAITASGAGTWVYFFNFPLTTAQVKTACSQSNNIMFMIGADYTRNN